MELSANLETERDQLKRERALYHHAHNCEQAHAGDNYAYVQCTCGADDDMQETLDHFHGRGAEAMREAVVDLFWGWGFGVDLKEQRLKFNDALRALPIPERRTGEP